MKDILLQIMSVYSINVKIYILAVIYFCRPHCVIDKLLHLLNDNMQTACITRLATVLKNYVLVNICWQNELVGA